MATSQSQAFLGVTLTAIDDSASFHDEARYRLVCAVCGRAGPFDAHHVLERKHCKMYRVPVFSPDNALRLCAKGPDRCHERHTSRQQRVPVACLRDENIAFIVEWLGRSWAYEYLRRNYSGADPRLDALLEIA